MPDRRLFAFLLLLLLAALSFNGALPLRAAELQRPDLLAHGSAEQLFVARTQRPEQPGQTPFTQVDARSLPSGAWRQITKFAGRATALTSLEGEFVLLLDSGDWWYGKGQGPLLPDRRRVRLIASEGPRLWAVGALPQDQAAEDAPATAPTTVSSGLILYRLDKSTWRPIDALPDALSGALSPRNASMVLVNGRVMIARLLDDGSIATDTWSADEGWTRREPIKPPFVVRAMRLLDVGGSPALWVAAQSGPGVLYHGSEQWGDLRALTVEGDLSGVTQRAITVAAERIRLLFLRDEQLFEQQFDETGAAMGAVSEMVLPKPPDQRVLNFLQLAMMFALMFLLMGSVSRRPIPQKLLESTRVRIAPMWPRLAAGIIDALPYLVGVILYAQRVEDTAAHITEPAAYPVWIGLGVYFLHITLSEMFRGQTIGKLLFGLRVVNLEGQKARPGAILVRNIILMVEVFLLFPLVLMFYSPLRQRIGDMTARTLVISTRQPDAPSPPTDGPSPTE